VLVDENDDQKWEELYKLSGMRTMPQIFVGDQLIGGFTDLDDLDKKQGLDHLKS
jgi:glutaredoxin